MVSSSMCKAVTPVTASRAIQTKAAAVHSCAKRQKPAENEIKKIREIDGSYCNDLTNFEYVVLDINGNGSYLNLQKLA
jgi:hypothetical protein